MLSCEVPGVSMARSIQRRDATGSAWICALETLVDTVETVVSTTGASPVTVTDSSSFAGFRLISIVAVWSMTSSMSGRVSVPKPCNSIVST